VAFCLQRSCKTSKYDRLLYILNLLRSRNNSRASDLAEESEASERTIYRDVIDLSSANIPIYFDDGSLLYEVKGKGTEEILRWILGFKDKAEVSEPEELRDKPKQISRKLARIYA
jgi:predicted DNA-binding transcriptional regulator YafY